MEDGFSCLFTIYGEVYVGNMFDDHKFQDYKIIVPRSKIKEFIKLQPAELTKKKINELGWIIPKIAIANLLYLQEHEFERLNVNFSSKHWDLSYDRRVMFIIGAGASANCVFGDEKEKL